MGAKKTKRAHAEALAFVDQLVLESRARVDEQLAELTVVVDTANAIGERTRVTLRDTADEALRSRARLRSAVDEAGRGCAPLEEASARAMAEIEQLTRQVEARRSDLDPRIEAHLAELETIRSAGVARLAAAIDDAAERIERNTEEQLDTLRDACNRALQTIQELEAAQTSRLLEAEHETAPPEAEADTSTPCPTALPPAAPAPEAPPPQEATGETPTSRTGNPVEFQLSRGDLLASVAQLAGSAPDGWIRIEPVLRLSHGDAASSLRLTARDVNGGWEHHDIPGRASSGGRPTATVDAKELLQAIELGSPSNGELTLTLDGDITIGTLLVMGHAPEMVIPSGERHRIEAIELRESGRDGVVLETLVGRLVVPSRTASSLRSRRAAPVDLITIGDRPFLSALVPSPMPDVIATIVTPVDAGDARAPSNERRETSSSPVMQLVGALSVESSPEDLTAIINDGVGYARRRAAAHPALPPGIITAILRDGTEAMRSAAASNPGISVSSIETAVVDPAPVVRAAVAKNPATPPALLVRLARDDSADVRTHVARNPALQPELLTLLADDPDARVREMVAAHGSCRVETLAGLATDAYPAVCAKVAANAATPPELLDQLLSVVPEVVLGNPRASEQLLVAGTLAQSPTLRAVAAANPSTPARELQALARDNDRLVVAALATNPNAPASARKRARQRVDRDVKSRRRDATAPST